MNLQRLRHIMALSWSVSRMSSLPLDVKTECLCRDVSYESYKAYRQGPTPIEAANFSETTRIGMLATKRAVFQSIASMALPAFTIHTIVKWVLVNRGHITQSL